MFHFFGPPGLLTALQVHFNQNAFVKPLKKLQVSSVTHLNIDVTVHKVSRLEHLSIEFHDADCLLSL